MTTHIAPMLAVSSGKAAVEFYERAFGAVVHWHIDGGDVAGLSIENARFFLADESPRTVRAALAQPDSRPFVSSCSLTTRSRSTRAR